MYKRLNHAYMINVYKEDFILKLQDIHKNTQKVNMSGELPEQKIIFGNLPRNSKVLEIGGNIGRASIIISNLLKNPLDHVVVESDPKIADKLKENRYVLEYII